MNESHKITSPVLTGSLTFRAGAGEVKLHPDGTVEITEGVSLDEAAAAFWKAVEQIRPKAPAVAWRWPNPSGKFLDSEYIYIDSKAPECKEDCEALFLSPSDERKKTLQELLDCCNLAIAQNDRLIEDFTPSEFMEKVLVIGSNAQAKKFKDYIIELLGKS